MMYLCKPCDAYVGCHKNSRMAMGSMANYALRRLRQECHKKIDYWWREKEIISRKNLYELLSKWWGEEFHVGWLNEKDCNIVINQLDISDLVLNSERSNKFLLEKFDEDISN